jgi:hypothetical protein
MRVTLDKNDDPYPFCEATCDGQMRVGGKPRRVAAFYKLYAHLKRPGESPPVAVASVSVAPPKVDATETAKPNTPPAKPARKTCLLDQS